MIWNYSLGIFEFASIGIFVLAYSFYFLRIKKVGKVLNQSTQNALLKFYLRFVYFILILISILGPSFGLTEQEAKSLSKDIHLFLDVSESMNATDVNPTRLIYAKSVIQTLLNENKEARISLTIFSEDAYTFVPLTYDHSIISRALKQIETDLLEENGTNLSSIMEWLQEHVKPENDQREKVAVVFTDGENFGTWKKTDLLKLRMAFAGIGKEEGGLIQGTANTTKLNKEELSKIAKTYGGATFFLQSSENALKNLVDWVARTTQIQVKEKTVTATNNKYLYFLIPAIFLLFIDIFFPLRVFKMS